MITNQLIHWHLNSPFVVVSHTPDIPAYSQIHPVERYAFFRGFQFRITAEETLSRGHLVVLRDVHLIPFATYAFVFQCQECASKLPSLLVFPMISTDFTPTP